MSGHFWMFGLVRKPPARSVSSSAHWERATGLMAVWPRAYKKDGQLALRRDLRVELADAAGGGVAGVGEDRLPGGLPGGVDAGELGVFQVDFAAHLHQMRAGCRPRAVAGAWRRQYAGCWKCPRR